MMSVVVDQGMLTVLIHHHIFALIKLLFNLLCHIVVQSVILLYTCGCYSVFTME